MPAGSQGIDDEILGPYRAGHRGQREAQEHDEVRRLMRQLGDYLDDPDAPEDRASVLVLRRIVLPAIAAIGGMAIRLAQMTGWVSWTLMGIYGDLGEIEDGMRTLSPAHALTDRPGAPPLTVTDGRIDFDRVTFGYGRLAGGG